MDKNWGDTLTALAREAHHAVERERQQYEIIVNFYEEYVPQLINAKNAAEEAARKLLAENEQLRKELDRYRYPSEEEIMEYEREYLSNKSKKLNLGGSNVMRGI